MRKDEFLKMMVEDVETQSEPKKSLYMDVIECMDIALSQSPDSFDVPPDKTVSGAFELIEKRGKVLREVPLSELGDWGVRHKVVA